MSAATKKSSQKRRTKIPRFRQRVADSRWNDNYKLRVGEGPSMEHGAWSMEHGALRSEIRNQISAFQEDDTAACFHSLSFCGGSRVGCKKRARDTRAITGRATTNNRGYNIKPRIRLGVTAISIKIIPQTSNLKHQPNLSSLQGS